MRVIGDIFIRIIMVAVAAVFVVACSFSSSSRSTNSSLEFASYFDLSADSFGNTLVIAIDPVSKDRDTITVESPFSRIVCMSSSFVAALSAVGKDSVVVGVSGLNYLSNEVVRSNAREVGYEASPDYETIISLEPDLVVAYSTSGSTPAYVTRLRDMGLRVFLVSDFLEEHPLARAEYVKLFGALTGSLDRAGEFFNEVCANYEALTSDVHDVKPVKVLINIPYSDQWFIPGEDNYTSRLVKDAGGVILGSKPSQSESSVITLEDAFMLSTEADVWLHPGSCSSIEELKSVNPLFKEFPVIGKRVYNNTLRSNSEGGNDFWETGAMRPDLILSDLISILHPEVKKDSLHFYVEVR